MLAQKMTLRPHTIYAIVLCLLTATLAPGESAATTPLRGKLWVTPVEHLECAGETAFVRGESVLLTGSGFAPDETVRITFLQGDSEADVASATVKTNGSLQGSVAIPVDADAAQTGKFRATGDVGDSGKGLILTSISLQIFAGAGDVDGDGAPDICDNCIDVANGDLLDDDGDGIGDACDKCPADRENDADRDGLCADVDPDPWAP